MAKSRARFLSELLGTTGLVKKSKSALAGADEVLDLDTLPTIPNSKLANATISIAGHSTALGESVTLNTGNIAEHTNYKYFTDARARAAVSVSGDLAYNSSTGVFGFTERTDAEVRGLVSATGSLSYNSTTGVFSYTTPTTIASLSNHDTADLAEGTNLYFTNARARSAISATGSLSYNSTTGAMSFTMPAQNTSNITEGSNLYFTNARADARIAAASTSDLSEGSNLYYTDARADARIAAASTSDLSEGTNLYYTDARADARVALIVDSAPGTLNTLNELAAALGDDANFATTVSNSIGTKWTQDNTKISNWDTAYGWGNHASAGYYAASNPNGYTSNVGDIEAVVAGTGLTGGATSGNATLNVIGGDGITANANDITVDSTVFRNNSAQYLQFNTTTGEALTFKNSTSGGLIQVGFQQNDTDGMHHRLYLKAWKGSTAASGNVDLIVRGTGGSITSDVFSLRSGNASPTWRGQTIWNAGNDGSGSGLDADLLDGLHQTSFVRTNESGNSSDLNGTGHYRAGMFSWLTTTANKPTSGFGQGLSIVSTGDSHNNSSNWITQLGFGTDDTTSYFRTKVNAGGWSGWRTLWNSANDGSGSGLDADTVDGIQASSFIRLDTSSTQTQTAQTKLKAHSNAWAGGLALISQDGTDTFQMHPDNNGYMYVDKTWYFTAAPHIGSIGSPLWHPGNDGSGSGLDADLLDGTQSSGFHNVTSNPSTAGHGTISIGNNGSYSYVQSHSGQPLYLNPVGNLLKAAGGGDIWHAGNDGSGSGLDADLLDGQQGSYYLSTTGKAADSNLLDGIDSTYFNRGDNAYGVMVGTSGWNMDDLFTNRNRAGFFDVWSGSNFPSGTTHVHGIQVRHNASAHYGWQLAGQYGQNKLWHRQVSNNSWGAWNQQWGSGNDGSGSGLDADLFDGRDSADYVFGTSGKSVTSVGFASLTNSKAGFYDVYNNGTPTGTWYSLVNMAHHGSNHGHQIAGSFYSAGDLYNRNNNNTSLSSWAKIWNTANDGAGSGLDADLLDGQQGSYYLTASNFTGTAPTGSPFLSDFVHLGTSTTTGYATDDGNWGSRLNVSSTVHAKIEVSQEANSMRSAWYAHTGQTGIKFGTTTSHVVDFITAGTVRMSIPSNSGLVTTANQGTLWGSSNDGAGSGLDADLLDGYNTSTSATANTVVVREGSGHIYGNYILGSYFNASSGNNENPTIGQVWTQSTGDNYLRKSTPAHFASQLHQFLVRTDGSNPAFVKVPANYTGNLNSITNAGVYFTEATGSVSNNPFSSSGSFLQLGDAGGTDVRLQFYAKSSLDRIAFRNQWGNGNWGGWHEFWTTASDGSGSGLDADLLDGQQGSYYYAASNPSGYQTGSGTVAQSNYVSGSAFATTGSPGSVLEYQQASGQTDTKLAPSGDWYNSIRMGHGNPYSYYSSLIAVRMTGSGSGDIYTQNIAGGTANGWRKHWSNANDGSGSGLDADTVDGIQGASFLRSDTATTGTTITASDAFRSNTWEDNGGTHLFRSGSGSGRARHLNLADTTTDPSAVSDSHNPTGISWGTRSDNNGYYMLGLKGAYNNGYSTYSRMVVGWHTGLEIGANPSYGGTRFFSDSPYVTSTEIMSVGKGDSNVRVSNNFFCNGVVETPKLYLNGGAYEGSIVFGSTDSWRTGIRQHDDADAELRIWAKNSNGRIHIATGYDGQPASISRPTDGFVVDHNNVGIGAFHSADPAAKLHVKGVTMFESGATTTFATPNVMSYASSNTAGASQYHIRFVANNGNSNGNISTNYYQTTYATTSDYRVKEDFQPMVNATSRLMSLNPVNFQWKDSDMRTDGFLAHEVAEVVSDAVVGEKDAVDAEGNDELQSLDQSKLVPLLVKTIQELEARITALESANI